MSDYMNEQLRGARGVSVKADLRDSGLSAGVNATLRQATGRGQAPEQRQEGNEKATPEQLAASRAVGLPDKFADRLSGDLRADARMFADAYAGAGGALTQGIGFDGGVRSQPSAAPDVNDMSALIRGHRMVQKQRVHDEARIEQRNANY